jgi:hypothetical protein
MTMTDQLDQAARSAAVALSALPAVALLGATLVVLVWAAWRRSAAPALARYGLLELARMWAGAVAGVLAFGIGVLTFGGTVAQHAPRSLTFLQAYTTAPALLPGWFVLIAATAAVVCGLMFWHLLATTTRHRPETDAVA